MKFILCLIEQDFQVKIALDRDVNKSTQSPSFTAQDMGKIRKPSTDTANVKQAILPQLPVLPKLPLPTTQEDLNRMMMLAQMMALSAMQEKGSPTFRLQPIIQQHSIPGHHSTNKIVKSTAKPKKTAKVMTFEEQARKQAVLKDVRERLLAKSKGIKIDASKPALPKKKPLKIDTSPVKSAPPMEPDPFQTPTLPGLGMLSFAALSPAARQAQANMQSLQSASLQSAGSFFDNPFLMMSLMDSNQQVPILGPDGKPLSEAEVTALKSATFGRITPTQSFFSMPNSSVPFSASNLNMDTSGSGQQESSLGPLTAFLNGARSRQVSIDWGRLAAASPVLSPTSQFLQSYMQSQSRDDQGDMKTSKEHLN